MTERPESPRRVRLEKLYSQHPRWVIASLVTGFVVGWLLFLLISELGGGAVLILTALGMLPFLGDGPGGGGGLTESQIESSIGVDLSSGPFL